MKNMLILFLSLMLLQVTGCGEIINSTWKSQDITIDGNGNDWKDLPLQYQEDLNMFYGVINDDKTIDFMIRFNDEKLARLFSMRGFALWLNEQDQEEKQIGIHYRDDLMRDRFLAGEAVECVEEVIGYEYPIWMARYTGSQYSLPKSNFMQ